MSNKIYQTFKTTNILQEKPIYIGIFQEKIG